MLKKHLTMTVLFTLFLSFFACAPKTPDEFSTEQALYEYGLELFNKRNYGEAVKFFETFKNKYPTSPYIVEAEFKLGESYYKNGDYIEAVYSFQNFITLHPTSSKVPDAVYYIALAYYKQSPKSISRDQTNTVNAVKTLRGLLQKYPNFERTEEAKNMLNNCVSKLAKKEIYIADFYFKQGSYKAAIGRYESIKNTFKSIDVLEKALFKLALSYHELKNNDKALVILNELLAMKPSDTYEAKARNLISKIK